MTNVDATRICAGLRSDDSLTPPRLSTSRASTAMHRHTSRDPEITVDIYIRACRKLGVPPRGALKRQLTKPVLNMRNSSLGSLGAKACAISLVVSKCVINILYVRTVIFRRISSTQHTYLQDNSFGIPPTRNYHASRRFRRRFMRSTTTT